MPGQMTMFELGQRAMSAQLVRMNAAASNLANAGSVAASEDEAYRPLRPVFAEHLDAANGISTATSGSARSMRTPRWSRCSKPRASTRT